MDRRSDVTNEMLALVVAAAIASSTAGSLATDLGRLGIPVLVLKGPPLQRRLFGTDAAYRSADVDLLVPRRLGRRARRFLASQGWMFLPENGLLWRLDRAAGYTRGEVTVDLHWGLHVGLLAPRFFRELETAMWAGARRAPEGWYEPRLEPLVVYLAVHAANAGYSRPEPLTQLQRAAEGADMAEVGRLAGRLGVGPTVEHALARAAAPSDGASPPPLLLPALPWPQQLVRRLRGATIPVWMQSAIRGGRWLYAASRQRLQGSARIGRWRGRPPR